jgi:hypothetical protein
VVSDGVYETRSGRRRRYKCTPPVGEPHRFSVVVTSHGTIARGWSPPPECPEHPGSRVVRNGVYGKTTAKPRQRYLCHPVDGSAAHSFTPVLARDHVHEGHERCDECDEQRGVHHGETTAARTHSWNTRLVAEALERLSRGDSYAEVSRWARRVTGTDGKRIRRVWREGDLVVPDRSDPSRQRRNGWHTAADWVEAFAPVVFEPVVARLWEQARMERARLDALIAAGKPLDRPQVVLLDDKPVYGRTLDRAARRDDGFYLLVVAEQLDDGPTRRPRLRLVRAMPKSNMFAWRLVFDELGYEPDVIVADAGTGIGAAVRAHFDPSRTKFVPSMWHLIGKVEKTLAASPRATVPSATGIKLVEPLHEHLKLLTRHSGALDDERTWGVWWDELETLAVRHRAPLDKVRSNRKTYEPAVAEVLDIITTHPDVPIGTGGLERLMKRLVEPMLAGRRHAFGNLERTNHLFDLVVCRDHHAFDNIAHVADLLREDVRAHDGNTVALRSVRDPRPPGGYYSSLRDEHLLYRIAKERGLT